MVRLIFGIQGFLFLLFIIVMIYLIVRRIEIRKHEDFEDRDN